MKQPKDTKKKKFEWSKVITFWVLALNTFVIYHGIHLCYEMIKTGSIAYNFGWLTTLIAAVIGFGDVVLSFYMNKSKSENQIKLENAAKAPQEEMFP